MAHKVYQKAMEKGSCPHCGSSEVTISTFHFGATYQAECAWCGFGKITGDNEQMAMARLYGNILKASNNTIQKDTK